MNSVQEFININCGQAAKFGVAKMMVLIKNNVFINDETGEVL